MATKAALPAYIGTFASSASLPKRHSGFLCATTDTMPPTNPSTTKARRRTVEDAAKRADYRAMSHVREKVQNKAEYKNATAKEREEMLERAMRENMEKRYVISVYPRVPRSTLLTMALLHRM